MANVDHTRNANYITLSAGQKTTVDAAVVAIRAAYASAAPDAKKGNVKVILREILKGQEET